MPNLKGSELLILLLLIVLLFGAKRLPDAARGVGRSLRIFKAETKGLTESDTSQPGPALDQTQGSAERATGIVDPSQQAPAGHEIPKPPTSQS